MFRTGWLTVGGLLVEILGLSFLFWDLLTTKKSALRSLEFHETQDRLESTTRELIVRLNRGLLVLAEFLSGYFATLELQDQFSRDPKAIPDLEGEDPEYAKLLAVLRGTSPVSLRSLTVERLAEAKQQLPTQSAINVALSQVHVERERLRSIYEHEVEESRRLHRVVRLGVAFVAVGALCQLLDVLT